MTPMLLIMLGLAVMPAGFTIGLLDAQVSMPTSERRSDHTPQVHAQNHDSTRISLDLVSVTFDDALKAVAKAGKVRLVYSKHLVPLERHVSLRVTEKSVLEVLRILLRDTGVEPQIAKTGQIILQRSRGLDASSHSSGVSMQTGTILGRVTDAKTGSGLAGADVFLENTRWRTVADTGGRYRLDEVEAGSYSLRVRRLGYAKQSRLVTVGEGQADTVDVRLEPIAARLAEVVTTATGLRRRLDIANDITTINADSVMRVAPIRSLTELLESRVPGLAVQRTSGAPGDPARLRLRGMSSPLRGNDPIVIVDGVRTYAEQSAGRSGNLARRTTVIGGTDTVYDNYSGSTPSPLDRIDPNTIETVEVFKGPSAATMYGPDAANGVIVITTKRGKAGPTRWATNLEHSRETMGSTRYPTLYLRWGHRLYDGDTGLCPITNVSITYTTVGEPCVGDSVVAFQLLNDPTLTVIDRGHRNSVSMGASGGTPALTYSVIGSYADELGVIKLPTYEANRYQSLLGTAPPDWMRRPLNFTKWGVTSAVVARLGATANVTLTTGLARSDQQKSSLLDQLGRLMSTYLDQSSGKYYQGGVEGYFYEVPTALRSYFERATDHATSFMNALTATWQPHSWLTLSANAGLDLDQRSDNVFFPRGPANAHYDSAEPTGLNDTTGYVNDGQGTAIVSTINLNALAQRSLGRGFLLHFAAGFNYNGTSTNDVAGGSSNLAPGSSLQGAHVDFLQRSETSVSTFGWYIDPSVGNSKVNFNAGLRLDGGSTNGANVTGFSLPKFPKLGFSYLVSDESWFPLKDLVQSLRLRISYGRSSRQPGPTDRLRLYDVPRQLFADSQFVSAVTLQSLGNPDVRPEQVREVEGGFDADLLDNRLRLSFSSYLKSTTDALLGVPVGPSVYGSGVTEVINIGVTRNIGVDLAVGADLVRTGFLTWGGQLLLSQRRDVVVSLAPGLKPFYTIGNQDYGQRIVPGYPLNGRWSRPIVGYADANGDGVLVDNEIQIGDTAIYVGNTLPNYQAAFTSYLSLWHGRVRVNASFAYENGVTQENQLIRDLAAFSAGRQVPGTSLAEQAATMNLTLYGPSIGDAQGLEASTDYNWLQTVNTLRFNELGVVFTAPARVARWLGTQTLSVALQGRNLGLHTNYRGLDPNVNAFGNGNLLTDNGILPQPRTWQLQINANY